MRRRSSRNSAFLSGFCVSASRSRKSRSGSSHSSPESIIASIDLSLTTTVQTQQPKRELPQLGVVLSTTSGHSPACALRYMATRSRLSLPQGEGFCSRYVQTSSVVSASMGP